MRGSKGIPVVGLIGKPLEGSISSGRPVLGLNRVPLLIGKPETASIGNVDGSIGVVTGSVSDWPFAGLKGTPFAGLIGKPLAGSMSSGRPLSGLINVPLLVGKPLFGSIGNVDGLKGVVITGSPFAGLNGVPLVGSMGKPLVGSISSGSPLTGLTNVPLLVGKPLFGSIGNVVGSTGVITGGVVAGTPGVLIGTPDTTGVLIDGVSTGIAGTPGVLIGAPDVTRVVRGGVLGVIGITGWASLTASPVMVLIGRLETGSMGNPVLASIGRGVPV